MIQTVETKLAILVLDTYDIMNIWKEKGAIQIIQWIFGKIKTELYKD